MAKTKSPIQEIKGMTNLELAACWNVCQFQRRSIGGGIHEHEGKFAKEMSKRGIPHEINKRVNLA